jgi:DNA topoisomerase VI subunit B
VYQQTDGRGTPSAHGPRTRNGRSTTQLNRTTFSASRAAEYFDARQLSTLTGVSTYEFANVILKELVDNSLDACETAGVQPEIDVTVDDDGTDGAIRICVSDNGPGIPSEVVRSLLDYGVRVSDKAAYRSPTRGAQGNALKTVIGIPYALGSRDPLTITARDGVVHTIKPNVDPAGNVRIGHAESNGIPWTSESGAEAGTIVNVPVRAEKNERSAQDFQPQHWVRSFAAFNPHATFRYLDKRGGSEDAVFYKSSREDIKKYVPSQPTSPHWYSAESLKVLIFSHIAHAREGGQDLPLGAFVRQFAGLTSSAKAKAVGSQLPSDLTHLSDFEDRPEDVAWLLAVMQEQAKEPKATSLGYVGKEHFEQFFEGIYNVNEFNYARNSGTMPSSLPVTFELAVAILDEPGHLYCGINFSPTFGDPLEGTTLAGPKFKADGIRSFLSGGHALPETDNAWFESPASVAVAAHIVTPAPLFLDRGKTRLNMEGA